MAADVAVAGVRGRRRLVGSALADEADLRVARVVDRPHIAQDSAVAPVESDLLEVAELAVAGAVDTARAHRTGLHRGRVSRLKCRERGAAVGGLEVALEPLRRSRNGVGRACTVR